MATTSRSRSSSSLPPIRLDPTISNQALRVRSGLRTAILNGLLAPGCRLPSSRELAAQLGIGRNAIVAAYEHLMSDGLIEARHGSGTYVSTHLPAAPSVSTAPHLTLTFGRRQPFALGQTHVEPAFLSRLAAATRRHVAGANLAELAYGDPRGSPRLRRQIADFLAVKRGIRCDPDCVVVVSGTQHGLRLCADALLAAGDPVWLEDPGYGVSRTTLAAAGARPVPVPVDARGLDVAAGMAREPRAKAAYVTPSHQFPIGVRMAMDRRVALIEWAETADAWIFEDDYDSEYRYSGPPLTALAGLSPGRVIYLGTFAKTLFPGLRLGYLVAPFEILEMVLKARAAVDRFTPPFMQDAVADLMADGTIAAQQRRNLRRYRAARDLVVETIGSESKGLLRPDTPDHGLHMIAWLREDLDPGLAPAIRQEAGVETLLLSETRLEPGAGEGFLLGFSGYEPEALRAAATALATAARRLADAGGGSGLPR